MSVWCNVVCDYTIGMIVALASDVDEARRMLLAEWEYIPETDLAQEPLEVTEPTAFAVWGGG